MKKIKTKTLTDFDRWFKEQYGAMPPSAKYRRTILKKLIAARLKVKQAEYLVQELKGYLDHAWRAQDVYGAAKAAYEKSKKP